MPFFTNGPEIPYHSPECLSIPVLTADLHDMSLEQSDSVFLLTPVELQLRVLDFCDSATTANLAAVHSSWTESARDALYRHIAFVAGMDRAKPRLQLLAETLTTRPTLASRVRALNVAFDTVGMTMRSEKAAAQYLGECIGSASGLQYLLLPSRDECLLDETIRLLQADEIRLRGLKLSRDLMRKMRNPDSKDLAFRSAVISAATARNTTLTVLIVDRGEDITLWDALMDYAPALSIIGLGDDFIALPLWRYVPSDSEAALDGYLHDLRQALVHPFSAVASYQVRTLQVTIPLSMSHVFHRTLGCLLPSPTFNHVQKLCISSPPQLSSSTAARPLQSDELIRFVGPLSHQLQQIVIRRSEPEPIEKSPQPLLLDTTPESLAIALGDRCPCLTYLELPTTVLVRWNLECNQWKRII
ncbi:hypothetical protein EXIGLDRAFT_831256 [Exidia glandulosa HHB12029]|uniref:F-box domain-containing protein n=1 Tax=Exidia glandulosa HHB12029 TaxID=1314781 RepID=A0A165MSX4_EXIGL|nr:hypothetical protein EXIGLDRAFT_831256 [Exidia glandulosa HHB12029]